MKTINSVAVVRHTPIALFNILLLLVALSSMLSISDRALAFHDTPDPTYKWDYSHVNHAGVRFSFDNPTLKRRGLSVRRLVAPYSATISDKVKRAGNSSVRVEIRPGDFVSDGWRAEIRDLNNAINNSVVVYKISTLIPEDFPNEPDNSFVLIQWHDQGVPWRKSMDRNPPLAVRYRNGQLDLTLRHAVSREFNDNNGAEKILFSRADLPRGVWHDMKFEVHWNPASTEHDTGYVKMWLNESQVADYTGPIGYFDDLGVYVKFGIYARHDVKSPHVVYHDEYQRHVRQLNVKADHSH